MAVTVGSDTSLPEDVTVSPAALLGMAVGDQVTLTDPSNLCLQFDEAAGAERYVIGVQSVSEVVSTLTGVRVSGVSGAAPVSPPLALPARAPSVAGVPVDLTRVQELAHHRAAEAAFMERSRALLESILQTRPTMPTPTYRTGPALIPGDVTVGTEVMLKVPEINANFCDAFIDIIVVVRSVGTRVIVTEDKDNPADGFVTQDFDDMASDFDTSIYTTLIDYFGEPTDMDANSRIVVVISKVLNEFGGVAGFAGSTDLVPVGTCPSSNEGEYYYSIAPDPTGVHGTPLSLEQSRRQTRLLLAHEAAHIIQLGRRMMAGAPFMASFMAEGGATAAEQFSAFDFEGRTEGENLGGSAIYPSLGADDRFYYSFMGDILAYFGFDPPSAHIADAPEKCSWVGAALVAYGPCAGVRHSYGVSFSVVQHPIDVYGPGLGGSQAAHRALVDHTGAPGFAAIEAVFGVSMSELLASWALTLYIDDRFVAPGLDTYQFLNWDLRSLEAVWGPEAELQPRARGFGGFSDDVSVRSASTAFFDVSGAGRKATSIRVTDQAEPSFTRFCLRRMPRGRRCFTFHRG